MPPRSLYSASPHRSYICPRCQSKASLRIHLASISRARPFSSTISHHTKYANLSDRRLLRLAGPDATNFLHDLIPAKILGVGTSPIYTAFLTAHGRILSDAFIYPPSWRSGSETLPDTAAQRGKDFEWWIEADEVGQDVLAKHFKKHKLRAKFTMEKVNPDATRVVYQWPEGSSQGRQETIPGWRAGGKDPRPGMGHRFILDADQIQSTFLKPKDEATTEDYTIHRMTNGLAEGHTEIVSGHALPQESNIDIVGGIDFHKGCYLGQELTIRTHHTGVVRKRIIPVQLYDDSTTIALEQTGPVYESNTELEQPPSESNLSKASSRRKGRSTGKWLGGVGNIGLALCRLEMMTDVQLTADTTNYDPNEQYKVQWSDGEGGETKEVKIKPFVPLWVREGIEQNLKRKEKKSPKRQEDDEDDDDVD